MDADREPTVKEQVASEDRLRNQQIRTDAELFEGLLRHPGWSRYMAGLEAIGNNFNTVVMSPIGNSLESVRTEFAKGALTGIQAAAQLPHAKIREARDLKLIDAEK